MPLSSGRIRLKSIEPFTFIGLFYFICGVVESLAEYAEQASAMDGTISNVERKLTWYSWLLVQILRIAKVPMVVVALLEGEQWTHDREKIFPRDGWATVQSTSVSETKYVPRADDLRPPDIPGCDAGLYVVCHVVRGQRG